MASSLQIDRAGNVRDRNTGADLGSVAKIGWPREVHDPSNGGRMVIEEVRWEARRPHETCIANSLGFPTFPTRRAAAAYLAGDR